MQRDGRTHNLGQFLRRLVPFRIVSAPPNPAGPRLPPKERAPVRPIIADFAKAQGADAKLWNSYLDTDRMRFFQHLVQTISGLGLPLSDGKIADMGSGTGYLLRALRQNGATGELTGFETFEDPLPLAQRLCPDARFELRSLSEVSERFDLIFCTEVLEHLVDPAAALGHLTGLLQPGGACVLTVPNGRLDRLAAGEMRGDGSAYWGHIHFWSPESWPMFLADAAPGSFAITSGTLGGGALFAVLIKPL